MTIISPFFTLNSRKSESLPISLKIFKYKMIDKIKQIEDNYFSSIKLIPEYLDSVTKTCLGLLPAIVALDL